MICRRIFEGSYSFSACAVHVSCLKWCGIHPLGVIDRLDTLRNSKEYMRTLGIVGGIGPESTIDYYRRIIAAYRAARPDGSYPKILINSIDMSRLLALAGANNLSAMVDQLSQEVSVLARAGATVALFASNTPHLVFDAVQKQSKIPLLSIVEATCSAAKASGLRRIGLLGTKFTMQSSFYGKVFGAQGISVVPPQPEEQELVHERYVGELVEGVFRPQTRDEILSIIEAMARRDGLDAVALAGTELPLLLRAEFFDGMPLLDTTGIHVSIAIDHLLA